MKIRTLLTAALLVCTTAGFAQILPGEQAPPADPGQRNFGGMHTTDTTGMAARMRARMAEMNRIRTVPFEELSMSDPYILADQATKTYYLTSSGGRMYKSTDLKMWTGPYNVIDIKGLWLERAGFAAAAEIHKIGDYYYYAGTWSDHSDLIQQVPRRYNVPHNQTYILRSDKPEGPYKSFAITPGYDYQPRDWDCIDGTLYEEDGKIYMIFVHEWTQLIDGTMDYIELAPDLSYTVSPKPVTMFRASELPCCGEMNSLGEATFGLKMPGWVTDGPQMFRTQTGRLGMLWSTWGKERYIQAVCYSESGKISGPWVQEPEPFLGNNSGHGMLFRTFEGKLLYVVHHVEGDGPRKPQFWEVDDSDDKLVLLKRWYP
ncbi:MAG: glycoside hydrolase family 43 protein [Bacteroidales bacterium]|nr:glycoside hydrolase family 43 protein [Bacteroidales bacterium]